jgi:hypothetical protein
LLRDQAGGSPQGRKAHDGMFANGDQVTFERRELCRLAPSSLALAAPLRALIRKPAGPELLPVIVLLNNPLFS